MKTNQVLNAEILNVVDNQIKNNEPPETKATFNRLVQSGISSVNAKKYIGQCVAIEIYHVLKHKQPFNEKRFISNLNKLPDDPHED